MRRLISALFALLSSTALGAGIQIRSLYENRSLLPGALLPFKVSGGQLLSVSVSASDGADCRAMVDPYRSDVFLLKCASAATVNLRVRVSSVDVMYGPLRIDAPAGLEIIPEPPPSSDGGVLAGKQLFSAYCLNCHNPAITKKGRSAATIANAIQNRAEMKSLKGVLSSSDLQKIEKYLRNP